MLNKNLKATWGIFEYFNWSPILSLNSYVMELIYQRDYLVHIWLFCVDNEVELHLLGQVMN